MRKLLTLTMVVLAVTLCLGCPRSGLRFTNADLNQGWREGGLYGLAPAELDSLDGEGNAEESREVVEPDVVRRAGNTLYVLNQYRGLILVDLKEGAIIAEVPTYGYPRDLYLANGRAYVLVGYASDYTVEENVVTYDIASRLYVVDIDDPANATILREFDLTGDLVDSRLVGDVLYAVCAEYQWYWADTISVAAVEVEVDRAEAPVKEQTSASWVTSINVADPANIQQVDEVSFEGLGDVIQATDSAIFVAATNRGWSETNITYVDIADPAGDIQVRGAIEINGQVADQYKMDAYEGVLRVVSSEWNWDEGHRVYVTTIDLANPDQLVQMGETVLEDALGETLFATRFDGPRAYIVTFLVVDPLFVVDLRDPVHPAVKGHLEVPGWSTHIEPRGDRLIALGVDDTGGKRRVCVSLFDVTDPAAPGFVDRVSFGEQWAWSSAYGDVKAFTVLDDMLLVPFSGWSGDSGGYDRLQFVTYTPEYLRAEGYVDLDGQIQRSFEYDGMYYGLTTEQLATIDATDPAEPTVVDRLTLAEYVADFVEVTDAVGASIISQYDSANTVLRTVDLADPTGEALGSVELAVGGFTEAHVYGESVVVITTAWDENSYESYYLVSVVDCATPSTPSVSATLKLDVQPYWGGWGWPVYGGYLLEMDQSVRLDKQSLDIMPPYWWPRSNPEDTSFLLGDILALRCRADSFNVVFGEEEAYQGLVLVDLAAKQSTTTVGFGYESIISLDAAGDKLYLGTAEYAGYDRFMPVCAYFIQEIDVIDVSITDPANVPGAYVQYDPASDVLTLRDDQWGQDWNVSYVLRTVSWDGGPEVELLDDLSLPDGTGQLLGRGAKVFMDSYEEDGAHVSAVSVSQNGNLSRPTDQLVSPGWANLLDAHGAKAYVVIGNAVVCYNFANAGAFAGLDKVMSSPLSMRFGEDNAYAPLGYSGLLVRPL